MNMLIMPDRDISSISLMNRNILEINYLDGIRFRDNAALAFGWRKVLAKVYTDGTYMYDISGHLANLLIMSHFYPICFRIWLDAYEINTWAAKGDKTARRIVEEARKLGVATGYTRSKQTKYKWWHTPKEMYAAIIAYLIFAKAYKYDIDYDLILYLVKRIKLIGEMSGLNMDESPEGRRIRKYLINTIAVGGKLLDCIDCDV